MAKTRCVECSGVIEPGEPRLQVLGMTLCEHCVDLEALEAGDG